VSHDLGTIDGRRAAPPTPDGAPPRAGRRREPPAAGPGRVRATAAVRHRGGGWRDPRLWVGLLLVAGSVLLGARVVAAADDSVAVWATAGDLGVGDVVSADDLVVRRVRFDPAEDLARYLPADEPLPADLALTRAVGAGELLPRAALGPVGDADVVEVPLAVEPAQVPPSVAEGSTVDVYVAPPDARGPADLVLEDVVVVDAPPVTAELGSVGDRQLVLAVPEEQVDRLPDALGAAAAGTVVVVREG